MGIGVFLLVELVVATPTSALAAGFTTAMALLAGAALVLVARALRRGQRWARSPAVLVQLFLLPVAYGLVQSAERSLLGWVLLAWGVATLALLLSPAVGRSLGQ